MNANTATLTRSEAIDAAGYLRLFSMVAWRRACDYRYVANGRLANLALDDPGRPAAVRLASAASRNAKRAYAVKATCLQIERAAGDVSADVIATARQRLEEVQAEEHRISETLGRAKPRRAEAGELVGGVTAA